MSDVKWIKIVTDVFDDDKILLIESLPEADSIIVIWFKLLCMAGKQNNGGVFMMNDKMPYTEEMLSIIFRRKPTIVILALKTFEKFGMIEIINSTITIPNWDKHQNIDGLDKIKEQTRLRVEKYRDKQKLLTGNVSVTLRNATDKSRIDKKRKEKEIKDIYADFVSMLPKEYEKLIEQFGEKGTKDRIENLNLYKGSKGIKYESDYLTILSWERKNKLKNKTQTEDWRLSHDEENV